MRVYAGVVMEKAMTRQEVILRAYVKKTSWIEAAEILGISARHLRRIGKAIASEQKLTIFPQNCLSGL